MERTWKLKESVDDQKIKDLNELLNLNHTICELLLQRGIENLEDAKSFFRPSLESLHDPFLMKGMQKATDRLSDAIDNKEKILIYGDYDVDGTTSVALVYNFLKNRSSSLFTHIPDRYTEGYGVSKKGIDWAIEHEMDLIIVLDCGIRDNETIKMATEAGIDTIICDHHLPRMELPEAYAILDPKQADCHYPYKELSGCGIGFKLIQAFCITNDIEINECYQFLDLLAISIASDIVPVTGENRILAWFGIKKINKQPSAGIAALIEKARLDYPLNITNVVFGLGPRINAAGRIGHAKSALDLFTQNSIEECRIYAEKLNIDNEKRKSYDQSITKEALEMIKREKATNSTVLYKRDWHKGVIGIVASRCIEQYYKPTIILTESNGTVTGSARSVAGFDIHNALLQCKEHLIKFGGHKYAAGMSIEEKNVVKFKRQFEHVVTETIEDYQKIPVIAIDLELELKEITFDFLNILDKMGPYGPQNMQPVFCSRGVIVKGNPKILKEKHLKMSVTNSNNDITIDTIGFGLAEHIDLLNEPFDIVYTVEKNNFRNEVSLQLMIKDIRAH